MTISIIIPAYNEEGYLPKTLESIKLLEREPNEVIVVDGGSTDKTSEIAKNHGAKVVLVPHRGIGFARQQGLEIASGDIVAFTDADTIVPPDWLSKIEQTLTQPGVVCVFGTFRVPGGWWIYQLWINIFQQVANQLLYWFGLPMAPGQNMAFLAQAARNVGGFPKESKILEDLEIARRLKLQGKVEFRQDLVVTSSGRRGNEGFGLIVRYFKVFVYYFLFHKTDKIGFPDIR